MSSRSDSSDRCPVCNTRKTKGVADNCPTCLMRLGARRPFASEASPCVLDPPGSLPRFANYELVEEVSRGGMGVVYLARQITLNRIVAVKVLLTSHFGDKNFVKRFRREAEAAAILIHPNIVSIYEVGEQDGQYYFSMEYVPGRNLSELARETPFADRRAARLLKTIAEAVQYAHEHNLLHRDLKPSNVVVDDLDVPHVTDFGLVKYFAEGSDLTISGQVLGTPSYMPPEQADPTRGPATAASDVYSLGAVLYHLLTTRPPFVADTLAQTLRLVADSEPLALRLLNPGVPQDLETICLKCLEKEPRSRYATARELAEELGRFLEDEPIQARPIGLAARLVRWCRRKPSLAWALGAVLTLLLVLGFGTLIAVFHIDRARQVAEAAQHETRAQLYTALLEQARATVRNGELGHRVRTLDAIRRAATIRNTADLRREAMAALGLADLGFERELPSREEFVSVLPDPSFQRIARCGPTGPIRIRSALDASLLATLPAGTGIPVTIQQWSPDGRFLASVSDGKNLEVWEAASAQRKACITGPFVGVARFHPQKPMLMTCQGVTASLWNIEGGERAGKFDFPGELLCVAFSPDGARFAAAWFDSSRILVVVRRFPDGHPLAEAEFGSGLSELAWHPAGKWIATGDGVGQVHLIDSFSGQTRVLGRHQAEAAAVNFSPDGRYLMSGGWEREMICWDMRRLERAFSIPLNSFYGAFRQDGREFAVITKSACLFHSFVHPTAHRDFADGLHGPVRSAAFSPDDRFLAVSDQAQLSVWNLQSDGPCAAVHSGEDSRISFSQAGGLFVSREGHSDRWQITANANTDQAPVLSRLELPPLQGVRSVCVASNWIVLGSDDRSRLLRLDDLKEVNSRPTGAPGPSVVSPDSRLLAMFKPFSKVLRVYRLPDLELVAKLVNQIPISTVEFSPGSDEIAVATTERIELWSTSNWKRTGEIPHFRELRYARGGSAWWLTADFRSAGLFDAESREPLLPLPTGMLPLAVSRNGRFLAVSVDGRRLQVWDLVQLHKSFQELGIDWPSAEATQNHPPL